VLLDTGEHELFLIAHVYFKNETSSLQWKFKLRNAGQSKRVCTLWDVLVIANASATRHVKVARAVSSLEISKALTAFLVVVTERLILQHSCAA
jgi:hypothetical protein